MAIYRRNGKQEIFSGLYIRYVPLIYGVAVKYLGNSADAQRAVMQLFDLVSGEVLKQEMEEFKSWLHTYTRDYCMARIGKVEPAIEENRIDFSNPFNPGSFETEKDKKKALLKCIEGLPEKQRIGVYRFFIEERSYKEIVDATGFSLKSVKRLVWEGRCNLKACLAEKGIR